MRSVVVSFVVLMVVGMFITEIPTILTKNYPVLMNQKVYWFFEHKKGLYPMEIFWYLKMSADDLLWVLNFAAIGVVVQRVSKKLFIISMIFLFYHFIDGIMFWWNFKTSYWLYLLIYLGMAASLLVLFLPIKEKSEYKSMI